MRTPGQYLALVRHMGPRWMLYRAGHAFRRRSGLLRRASPVAEWEQTPAPVLNLRFRAPTPAILASWGNACVDEAEAILRGHFRLFSDKMVVVGFPPDWHRNQLAARTAGDATPAGTVSPVMRHWSDLSDAGGEDIKGVWELSRFTWAFPLVRAYVRTNDRRFATAFWRLFQDWCDRNPPNSGPNWMCGQETAFRVMAVVFAVENLGVPDAYQTQLSRFVVASGRRISAHLDYALSQDNNHGISECVGLVTAGFLLPDEKHAAGWLDRGLRHLEKQMGRLLYDDGGFSQHSLIYHRVLLHNLCWCRQRADLAGHACPAWLDAAANRALEHLVAITDPVSGKAPLYGSNDGTNVLPLSETEFLDMRPSIQLASALFRNRLLLSSGPWDEAVAWVNPRWASLSRMEWVVPAVWHAPDAGCYQLCLGRDRLFFRCPTRFLHRPAQADMLHVDVWHDGRAIAFDGGSFSYNSRKRFTALSAAAHHNVITVDGLEPMRKFSRFLYIPWPTGTAVSAGRRAFRCSHDGYAALGITWIREVAAGDSGGFVVRDFIGGARGHRIRWHWRLADTTWRVDGHNVVETRAPGLLYRISWSGPSPGTHRLIHADETSAYGWWAPHYGAVQPAVALLIDLDARGDVEWTTEFKPLS